MGAYALFIFMEDSSSRYQIWTDIFDLCLKISGIFNYVYSLKLIMVCSCKLADFFYYQRRGFCLRVAQGTYQISIYIRLLGKWACFKVCLAIAVKNCFILYFSMCFMYLCTLLYRLNWTLFQLCRGKGISFILNFCFLVSFLTRQAMWDLLICPTRFTGNLWRRALNSHWWWLVSDL